MDVLEHHAKHSPPGLLARCLIMHGLVLHLPNLLSRYVCQVVIAYQTRVFLPHIPLQDCVPGTF